LASVDLAWRFFLPASIIQKREIDVNLKCPVKVMDNQDSSPSGGVSRFFPILDPGFLYCPKASRRERNIGLDDPGTQFSHGTTLRMVERTATRGNIHPTVKPLTVCRWLVRLCTPPGGTVLDLFCGSGSVGCEAVFEGFNFIGIDLTTEYLDIARARIAEFAALRDSQHPDDIGSKLSTSVIATRKVPDTVSLFGDEDPFSPDSCSS
jgi:SAM-dependent methyltransferase